MGQIRQEARERAQRDIVDKYGDLDELAKAKAELAKKREAEMSELEKLQAKLTELEQKATQAEQKAQAAQLNALRLEVGQAKGLTPILAARLQGTTREELEADADQVLAEVKPQAARPADLNATDGGAGVRMPGAADVTPQQIAIGAKFGLTPKQVAENVKKMRGE